MIYHGAGHLFPPRDLFSESRGCAYEGCQICCVFGRNSTGVELTKDFLEALKANDIRSRDFLDYADDILILHGTKDEVVPMESSKTFAEDQVIEFIPVENADHRFQNPAHMDLANKYVMDFFFS